MPMMELLAHMGHHDDKMGSELEHCTPILVCAGLIIVVLLGVILYLLKTTQPKSAPTSKKKK